MSIYDLEPPISPVDLESLAQRVNARFDAQVVKVGTGLPSQTQALSTAFDTLDAVTGFGGLPRGRLTELTGRPTSGRTTVAAYAVAAAEGYSAWVDVLGQLDVDRLARCGADLQRLFIVRPKRPPDVLALRVRLVAGGHFSLVVLDGLAEAGTGGGPTARAVGQFIRALVPRLGATTTAGVILSSPEHPHKPVMHAAALRIAFSPMGVIRWGGVFRGWRTRASILKAPGHQGAEIGLEMWLE